MKIICTAEEKKQFIAGVSYSGNLDCPIAKIHKGTCINGSCHDCVEKRIEWVIQDKPQVLTNADVIKKELTNYDITMMKSKGLRCSNCGAKQYCDDNDDTIKGCLKIYEEWLALPAGN